MASQTVTLSSSFTPMLATFNSRTLLPLPPLRTFSCCSSLPVPCLKACYGGIRDLNTSNFKSYAAPGAFKLLSRYLSQTVTLSSSFNPKLATFNSRTLPPSRTFSCSSALPMPCIKASYGGIRTITMVHFNYKATPARLTGTWQEIKDVEHVQSLGKFAVEEYNKNEKKDIKFIRVVKAEKQVEAAFHYRLTIEVEVDNKLFEAVFLVGHSDYPKDLKSFAPS